MFNSRSSISISTFLSSLIGSIMRGRRSVRCGQTCEYRKARLILTHDPGEELFLGALHPAAALFREHIDIPELIAEHATYRKVLEEAGARVLTVRQILLDGTGADGKPADRTKLENLRRFAAGFLTFDTQNLSPETAGQQIGSEQQGYEIHNKNIQYPHFFRYANILKFPSFFHKNLDNRGKL